MTTLTHLQDQHKTKDPVKTVQEAIDIIKKNQIDDNCSLNDVVSDIKGSYVASAVVGEFTGSGKGLTPEQSRASALMECLERYTWFNFDYEADPDYRFASYNELSAEGLPVVEKEYFFRFFQPQPLLEQYLADLLDVKLRWLPAKAVNGDDILYYPLNYHSLLYSSNGLASGNEICEAQVQAICELIEREAIRQLYMDGVPGKLIDQSSITAQYAKDFLASAADIGITFDLIDVGSSFGVPVIIARGHDPHAEGMASEYGCGQGCCPDINLAINRALSEYAEGRYLVKQGAKKLGFDVSHIRDQFGQKHMGFYNFYKPENFRWEGEPVKVDSYSAPVFNTTEEQLSWLTEAVQRAGHKLYYYDMTNDKLSIPVVRLFSPTMGSVINTNNESPEFVLAAVYHEAGLNKEAIRLFMTELNNTYKFNELMKGSPLAMAMIPGLIGMMPADTLFGKDYLGALKQQQTLKRDGMKGILNIMNQLNGMLGGMIKQ